MKKKITTLLLFTVLMITCVFGIGCSRATCLYETCSKCGNRAADCFESYGSCIDKCDFVCNFFMGETCHDRCHVSCWYNFCAERCRVGGDKGTCGTGYFRCWDCYKDDLTYLSAITQEEYENKKRELLDKIE